MEQKIDTILSYIETNRSKIYTIKNPYLENSTEFLKLSYFKMLSVVLHSVDDMNKEQINFFSRLVYGVINDYNVHDILRMSLSVESKDFHEFITNFKNNKVKYRFVLDSLILIGLNDISQKSLELVVGIMELFDFKKDDLECIAQLSKMILTDNYSSKNKDIFYKSITFDMLFQFINQQISENNDYLIINGLSKEKEFDIYHCNLNKDTLIISHVDINLKDKGIDFQNCKNLIFKHCNFILDNASIGLYKNTNILFESCVFKDCKCQILKELGNNNIEFLNCEFKNLTNETSLGILGNSNPLGSIVHTTNEDMNGINIFNNCKFDTCISFGYFNEVKEGILCNAKAIIKNCNFYNCKEKAYMMGFVRYEHTLFLKNSKSIDNRIENSISIT